MPWSIGIAIGRLGAFAVPTVALPLSALALFGLGYAVGKNKDARK